jgi:hypothetical protein
VEGKDKLLLPKWDSLCNHASYKKVENFIGTNVKKRDWYYSKYSRHAKNQKLLASHNREYVATQSANGVVGEKVWKVMQFATLLHLLLQGHPCWNMKQ